MTPHPTHTTLIAEGPFTRQRYTAAWVPLPNEKPHARGGVYLDSEGRPGCWTYRDDRGYGPSLGRLTNRQLAVLFLLERTLRNGAPIPLVTKGMLPVQVAPDST